MTECVLSVDIGTTSLKAGLISEEGEVVFILKKVFFNENSRFVAVKWLHALKSILTQAEKNNPSVFKENHLAAISVSGNGPTLVSSGGLTLRWNENYKLDYSLCAHSLFLPKLVAFKHLYPKEYKRADFLFSGPEYFIYELTGSAVTLLPQKAFIPAYWTDELLQANDILKEKLPPFIYPASACGNLKKDAADFLGLQQGLPIFCGGPDFVAALIGTNTLSPSCLCDRSGSSEGLNLCIENQLFYDNLRTLPSPVENLWNISYLIPQSSKLKEEERLEKIQEGLEELKAFCKENNILFPDKMMVTGGQTRNKGYLQRKANKLKMKIALANCSDAELLGDACVALAGLGRYSNIREAAAKIIKESKVYLPEQD